MIPLALTSTKGWIRRLGGKNWQSLHRLIYITAIAAVIHYIWLVKADLREPLRYAFVLSVLLVYRVVVWIPGLRKKPAPSALPTHPAETTQA
jgi:sulfoxide reductase heme-binding subunit YedZ